MAVKHFDPATLRRAAGLTIEQAAKLVHAAPSTWKNWEKSAAVTPGRADRVLAALRGAMVRRIEIIQAQIEQIDAHK